MKIKPNELRAGNIITDGVVSPIKVLGMLRNTVYGIYIQKELKDNGIMYRFNCDYLTPIPLTEKWLLDFGFKKKAVPDTSAYSYNNKALKVPILGTHLGRSNTPVRFFTPVYSFHRDEHVDILYIHQLQNIHFYLTGEELTISEYEKDINDNQLNHS